MEIRQLEAFAAVYSAGSVTAAGRLLDRSQPMVSRQIQDLEQELGFTLFTRSRPQVTLTDQGRQFYEEVRTVLASIQQLDVRSREIARGQAKPMRIAATYSLGATLVASVVGELEGTAPVFEHKLYIDTMDSEETVQTISDGRADIGVVSLPVDLGRCTLQWSGQAPYLLAMPVDHPLAASPTVKLDALGNNTVITLSNRSGLRHRLSTALLRPGLATPQRRHIETSSSMNALMLVRAGVGLALVDPLTATVMPQADVVYKSVDRYVPYVMGVITRRDRDLSADERTLIQALREYASRCVPRFIPGDPSGLPAEADPFLESAPKGPEGEACEDC
ncbi:LysR family transcriptional regulator [Pollutimonas thiosulfatoxidans]|uniref:LysR family transcriptional regulator n=1 Tax=Pollutimonas thiosulfatoxidans TaxID=2028345 RepID=A0A410GFN0_9BURK|nr:LysR family transcriptional regulator [Pollutimonas thiosulfatoxidans]QAA95112.1 LysR family transcriptional regulator [Pollutimonas thiosulfatoxidans]